MKDVESVSSSFSNASETSQDEATESYYSKKNDLTQLQEEIIYAIETLNSTFFVDLGGWGSINIDYEIDPEGNFPLGIACAKSTKDIANLILHNPTVDVNRITKLGTNAFWMAWESGKSEILPILVEKGINYLVKHNDGRNSLHTAVENNKEEVVKYLISIKFPLNIRITESVTAVSIAAQKGYFNIVKLLVEAGANINKLSNKGIGPLYMSIDNNQTEIANYLVDNKAKVILSHKYRDSSPLFLVIKQQNVEILKKFKESGIDLGATTSEGLTPLQFAAKLDCTKIMNYLIKKMPNLDQEDNSGFNIFSRYLLLGKFDIWEKLLENGSNINHININGKTPLHMAVECKKAQAIEFLVEHQANPHIEDFYGEDVCEKVIKFNIDLTDNTMFAFLQCRPDKRIKTEMNKIEENHKKEEEEIKNLMDEEGSSGDEDELEATQDRESLISFDNKGSSSSDEDSEDDSMLMTGSSFWAASEMGSITPSPSKHGNGDTYDSSKFTFKIDETKEPEEKSEKKQKSKPKIETKFKPKK